MNENGGNENKLIFYVYIFFSNVREMMQKFNEITLPKFVFHPVLLKNGA